MHTSHVVTSWQCLSPPLQILSHFWLTSLWLIMCAGCAKLDGPRMASICLEISSFSKPIRSIPFRPPTLLQSLLLSSAEAQNPEEMSDGTVPVCRPLNERTISATCTQLQKCCSLLWLVYTIWSVWEISRFHGRLEKSSKLSQSGKNYFGSSERPFPSP